MAGGHHRVQRPLHVLPGLAIARFQPSVQPQPRPRVLERRPTELLVTSLSSSVAWRRHFGGPPLPWGQVMSFRKRPEANACDGRIEVEHVEPLPAGICQLRPGMGKDRTRLRHFQEQPGSHVAHPVHLYRVERPRNRRRSGKRPPPSERPKVSPKRSGTSTKSLDPTSLEGRKIPYKKHENIDSRIPSLTVDM